MGTVRLELTWISPPPPQDGASAISPRPQSNAFTLLIQDNMKVFADQEILFF